MGSNRINRKKRNRNSPMVPTYVAQSQRVAWKIDHDDGRKSWARLLTIITYRSSHIPTRTMIDAMNRVTGLPRMRLNQSIWGATILQVISSQYVPAYGPV